MVRQRHSVGVVNFVGNGSTIQLKAIGEQTGGATEDITHVVTYNVMVDPNYSQDAYGNRVDSALHAG